MLGERLVWIVAHNVREDCEPCSNWELGGVFTSERRVDCQSATIS